MQSYHKLNDPLLDHKVKNEKDYDFLFTKINPLLKNIQKDQSRLL